MFVLFQSKGIELAYLSIVLVLYFVRKTCVQYDVAKGLFTLRFKVKLPITCQFVRAVVNNVPGAA